MKKISVFLINIVYCLSIDFNSSISVSFGKEHWIMKKSSNVITLSSNFGFFNYNKDINFEYCSHFKRARYPVNKDNTILLQQYYPIRTKIHNDASQHDISIMGEDKQIVSKGNIVEIDNKIICLSTDEYKDSEKIKSINYLAVGYRSFFIKSNFIVGFLFNKIKYIDSDPELTNIAYLYTENNITNINTNYDLIIEPTSKFRASEILYQYILIGGNVSILNMYGFSVSAVFALCLFGNIHFAGCKNILSFDNVRPTKSFYATGIMTYANIHSALLDEIITKKTINIGTLLSIVFEYTVNISENVGYSIHFSGEYFKKGKDKYMTKIFKTDPVQDLNISVGFSIKLLDTEVYPIKQLEDEACPDQ